MAMSASRRSASRCFGSRCRICAVDALGILELARAVACRRLREQFARRVGAQERMHGALGLVRPPRIAERVDEGKLSGLELRFERERVFQQPIASSARPSCSRRRPSSSWPLA